MNNPYRLLNEVDTPYQSCDLTSNERRRLQALVRKEKDSSYGFKKKGFIVALAVAGLVLGVGLVNPHGVRARLPEVSHHLATSFSKIFDLSQNGDAYTVTLHQSFTVGNESLRIDQMIFEDNIVQMTIVGPMLSEALTGNHLNMDRITVNGKTYQVMGSSSKSEGIDQQNAMIHGVTFELDDQLPPTVSEITMHFVDFMGSGDKANIEVRLSKPFSTTEFQVATNQAIPGAEGYVLTSLHLGPTGQHALVTIPQDINQVSGSFRLVATNAKGQQAVFHLNSGFGHRLNLFYSKKESTLSSAELIAQGRSLNYRLDSLDSHWAATPIGKSFQLH